MKKKNDNIILCYIILYCSYTENKKKISVFQKKYIFVVLFIYYFYLF
jgi:hypothetical protein